MFSPYYALARRRAGGLADPQEFCALNVALYGPGGRWSMTERGARAIAREPDRFVIGPSELAWDGNGLTVRFDEVCAPIPRALRGVVRLKPAATLDRAFSIDGAGRHEWRPIAPVARVEVACDRPALDWRGDGYFDTNDGDEPLEAAFSEWRWSRARTRDGARILYDVTLKGGDPLSLALAIDEAGAFSTFAPPPETALKPGLWRMARSVRSDAGAPPRLEKALEDAPFYTRSRIAARLGGEDVGLMHESLSLERFRMPVVQAMLPFRMPRRFW